MQEKITPEDHKKSQDDRLDQEYFDEDASFPWINHGDALWDGMIWWFRD